MAGVPVALFCILVLPPRRPRTIRGCIVSHGSPSPRCLSVRCALVLATVMPNSSASRPDLRAWASWVHQGRRALDRSFETMPWLGLKLTGVYDDRAADRRDLVNHPHWSVIGRSDDLIDLATKARSSSVWSPCRCGQRRALRRFWQALADTTVTVYLVADLLYCFSACAWVRVGGVPVVSLHDSPFQGLVAGSSA